MRGGASFRVRTDLLSGDATMSATHEWRSQGLNSLAWVRLSNGAVLAQLQQRPQDFWRDTAPAAGCLPLDVAKRLARPGWRPISASFGACPKLSSGAYAPRSLPVVGQFLVERLRCASN
jgi:hypothetical protein